MRLNHKKVIQISLAGVLACCIPAGANSLRAKSPGYIDTGFRQSIPLKIYRNFLVVAEGQFGGISGPQNFLLDTGTAPSVINLPLARALGLVTTLSEITAAGKTIPTQSAILSEIELGPIRAVSVPVQVEDLSQLERDWGAKIAGIIGMDVLSRASFHLDYDKGEIEFGEISREGIPVPYDARTGTAVAKVKLGGKTLRMLVDTGADRLVIYGGNFGDAGGLGLRDTSQWGASLADKSVRVQVFSTPDIAIGEVHFSEDRAYFIPGSTDPEFDGLLGVRALGFHGISYDRTRGMVYLQQ